MPPASCSNSSASRTSTREPSACRAAKCPRCPKCGRVLSPRAEVCIYCADKRRLFIRLVGLLKPHWKFALLSLVITLLMAGLNLIPPYLTKPIISDAILPGRGRLLFILLACYGGAMVLAGAMNFVRIRVMGWLGQRVIYDLRGAAFNRLQELSLRYYESKQTGKLMGRVTTDVERVERFVVEALQEIIVDVLTLTTILVLLLGANWKLAIIVILPTPLVAISVYFFSKRIKSTYRRAWRMSASLAAHFGRRDSRGAGGQGLRPRAGGGPAVRPPLQPPVRPQRRCRPQASELLPADHADGPDRLHHAVGHRRLPGAHADRPGAGSGARHAGDVLDHAVAVLRPHRAAKPAFRPGAAGDHLGGARLRVARCIPGCQRAKAAEEPGGASSRASRVPRCQLRPTRRTCPCYGTSIWSSSRAR